LKHDVHNGDSVSKVESLPGPAKRNDNPKYRAACVRNAAAHTYENPEGFEDGDELLGYKTSGGLTIHLQPRGGRLVNFNPADYPVQFVRLQ